MSLTKEEFDKRLNEVIDSFGTFAMWHGFDKGVDTPGYHTSSDPKEMKAATSQSLRQLMLDVTGDPAEDCDFCGSLDSIREIVKGGGV